MSLELTLSTSKGTLTTLEDGDILMINERDHTVGFLRESSPLYKWHAAERKRGDDKVIARGIDVRNLLDHLGIVAIRVRKEDGLELYRLQRQAQSMPIADPTSHRSKRR